MGSKGLNLLYMKELVELPLHLEQSARAQLKWNWMFEKIYMLTAEWYVCETC